MQSRDTVILGKLAWQGMGEGCVERTTVRPEVTRGVLKQHKHFVSLGGVKVKK